MKDKPSLRYAGHLSLPQIGPEGQEKLRQARVLCVGAGALGSPASMYLALAGVGSLGIADFDTVSESNLGRQLLHPSSSVGQSKVISAVERLQSLNPFIKLTSHALLISRSNASALVSQYDLVVDASDNFETKHLLNEACHNAEIPLVSGSLFQTEGQASVFNYQNGPCYRCLYPSSTEHPEHGNCSDIGVLSPLAGVMGSLQASEAIKIIVGFGVSLSGRLALFDLGAAEFNVLNFEKNPKCNVCSSPAKPLPSPSPTLAADEDIFSLSVDELLSCKQTHEVAIFDLRVESEFSSGKISGSHSLPMEQLIENGLPTTLLAAIDSHSKVVLCCTHEMRSRRALHLLRNQGVSAQVLTGGLREWSRLGHPLEASPR